MSARLRNNCHHAELALCSSSFKGSLTFSLFHTTTVIATTLFSCFLHHVRARGRVRDLSFVGLSIRYTIGPAVALSGSFCARKSFLVHCWFPVEDQVGWIFISTCILQVEVIRCLNWIMEVGTNVSLSISSVKAAHK